MDGGSVESETACGSRKQKQTSDKCDVDQNKQIDSHQQDNVKSNTMSQYTVDNKVESKRVFGELAETTDALWTVSQQW